MHQIGMFGLAAQMIFFKKYSIQKKTLVFPILNQKLKIQE